ncbi:hypothetical protein BRADI_1g07625v3 [Brachypodium distachyon]|uniref:Uncharacterized protein n=1 Tax=Brachypodium distachyon TaxID=15368 RepID=A0A2K2DII2_BRADI|nr:hypothetical protein BRADI_1g07625v3 [Brachypodium distachyon]
MRSLPISCMKINCKDILPDYSDAGRCAGRFGHKKLSSSSWPACEYSGCCLQRRRRRLLHPSAYTASINLRRRFGCHWSAVDDPLMNAR